MRHVILVYHRRGFDMGEKCSWGGDRGQMQHIIGFSASGSRLRAGLDLDNTWYGDQAKQIRNTYTFLAAMVST